MCCFQTEVTLALFQSNPLLFKRALLLDHQGGILIPERKFVPGRNWGENAMDEKNVNFYCLFI